MDLPAPLPARRQHVHCSSLVPDERVDHYHWLRDDRRTNAEVLAHLEAENSYARQQLAPLEGLVDDLCDEMDALLPEVEQTAPSRVGQHYYQYQRRGPGDQYWNVYRRRAATGPLDATEADTMNSSEPEQLVFDANKLSQGCSYFDVVAMEVSPDDRLLAYIFDTRGDERCELRVIDIASGASVLPQESTCTSCSGDVAWGSDSRTLYYVRKDDDHNPVVKRCKLPTYMDMGTNSSAASADASAAHSSGATSQKSDTEDTQADGGQRAGASTDTLVVYREEEEGFSLSLRQTSDGRFIVLKASSRGCTELRVLDTLLAASASTNTPASAAADQAVEQTASWKLLLDRQDDLDCLGWAHLGSGRFALIIDDDDAPDGEVVMVDLADPQLQQKVLVPFQEDTEIEDIVACGNTSTPSTSGSHGSDHSTDGHQLQTGPSATHLAVAIKRSGTSLINVYCLQDSNSNASSSGSTSATAADDDGHELRPLQPEWTLSFDDPTLVVSTSAAGPEGAAAPLLKVVASSRAMPETTEEVNLATRKRVTKHTEQVLGSFQPGAYTSSIEWAVSHDGTQVPITLTWHKELVNKEGTNPALLQAYGAYGSKQFPSFAPADVPLLNRGFVLAVAHVRGGGELGAAWHIHGKKARKANTFHDYMAAAHKLVELGLTSPGRIAAWGRSAGGLTVGAALNMAAAEATRTTDPLLFGDAILDVPFLDILSTMSDPELPLTVSERSEWGDPHADKAMYQLIRSYAPYDNLHTGTTSQHTNPSSTTASTSADGTQPSSSQPSNNNTVPNSKTTSGGVASAYLYPAMLLTASLHDHRVNYWEPAKYVAALRHWRAQVAAALQAQQAQQAQQGKQGQQALQAQQAQQAQSQAQLPEGVRALQLQQLVQGEDGQHQQAQHTQRFSGTAGLVAGAQQLPPLLLLTDMQAGHFASSGASGRLRERAVKIAFLLRQLCCEAV